MFFVEKKTQSGTELKMENLTDTERDEPYTSAHVRIAN